MSDWDFGGAYAGTEAQLLQNAGARAELPYRAQHMQSVNRLNNAQAAIEEHRLQSEQQMQQMMQAGQVGDPSAPQSTNLTKMAEIAMRAGNPTLAGQLSLRATQQHTAEQRELTYQAQQKKAEFEQRDKMVKRYGELMGSVGDENSFRRANAIFEQEFGERAPNLPYSPELVQHLRESSLTMAQRLRAEHDKVMERLRQQSNNSTDAQRAWSRGFRVQEEQHREEHRRRIEAKGGKDVGDPKGAEVDNATALLNREGKAKGLDDYGRRTAAFDLASRAKALRQKNAGLSAGEAMERAYVQQVEDGYYTTTKGGMFSDPKTTFGRPGGSLEKPVDLPKDTGKLKPDTYYNTKKGVLLYKGPNRWQVPQASEGVGSGDDGADDDDDDDDDEGGKE